MMMIWMTCWMVYDDKSCSGMAIALGGVKGWYVT